MTIMSQVGEYVFGYCEEIGTGSLVSVKRMRMSFHLLGESCIPVPDEFKKRGVTNYDESSCLLLFNVVLLNIALQQKRRNCNLKMCSN